MNKDLSSEYGQIRIHRRVIAQIAEMSAREVEGVKKVGLECYGLTGKILQLFRLSGSKVIASNTKEVKVIIPVVMEYGTNAVDNAYKIQRAVISKLLNTLNMDSISVDVKIKKIEGRGK